MDEGSRISTVQLQCEEQNSQCFSPLTMGWALKTITKKTRFTQKQNEFLKQQFEIGEQSGRKADPNEVSKMMRSSRDELGARRFLPEEVLTGQQITGFFSRLAAKKRLPPSTVNREESDEETTREDDRANVYLEIIKLLTPFSNVRPLVVETVNDKTEIYAGYLHIPKETYQNNIG